jgi:cytochrome c551/c552
MNFISNLITTPTKEHLLLNHYIIILISLIFFIYIGILVGSLHLSLIYLYRSRSEESPLFLKLSKDLAETFMGNKAVGVVMGIIPSLVLLVTFSQILFDTTILISQYFLWMFLFTVAGVVFSNLFKNALLNEEKTDQMRNLWGGLAILSLVLVIYTFVSSTSLILFPSLWNLVRMQIPFFFDFNMVVRFLIFFAVAFALTGSAIIFFFFNWTGGRQNMDEEYRNYVRKLGGGLSLGFALLLPLLIVWNFKTIPPIAETMDAYWSAAITIVLLLIISLLLYALLKNANIKYGSSIFVLFIIAFLGLRVTENIARERALTERTAHLIQLAEEKEAEISLQKGGGESTGEVDLALGEQIFNNKCIACHRFDQRLVGPPYNEVVPKYENDMEGLVDFILNPVKKNENYPMMPNQGLKPQEARAVAHYIMNQVQSNE